MSGYIKYTANLYLFCVESNEEMGLEDLVDDFVAFYSAGKRYSLAIHR